MNRSTKDAIKREKKKTHVREQKKKKNTFLKEISFTGKIKSKEKIHKYTYFLKFRYILIVYASVLRLKCQCVRATDHFDLFRSHSLQHLTI